VPTRGRAAVAFSGGPLPLVVQPAVPGVELAAWAEGAREEIARLLARHGALLFRGFGVAGAGELERVCEAAGTDLYGDYGDLPREREAGRVYGTTPYPPDQTILFHNESSHQHRFPRRLFFLCLVPAREGGATSLLDGRRLLDTLEPAAREAFLRKGLRYTRTFTPGIDVSWQDFFRTKTHAGVTAACRRARASHEWLPGGRLRVSQNAPAIARHPGTGERSFFNQIQLHHPSRLAPEVLESLLQLMPKEELPRNVTFGDGAPISDDLVEQISVLSEDLAVDHAWREGDVLAIENLLVAHARRPYAGDRRVLVAMGDMADAADVAPPGARPS
jgi:alpha-ketoglutarate-dependent taurine dioxygenase